MEVFNEFCIILVTVQFVIFTPFVDDPLNQYNVGGFSYMGLIFVSIFANGFLVVKNLFLKLKLIAIKMISIINNKYNKYKKT